MGREKRGWQEIGEQNRPTAQSPSANEYLYKRREAVVVFAWLEGDREPKRLEMLCRRIQIGMSPRRSLHRVRWSHPQFVSRHSRQFRNAFAVEIQIKHIALHHAAIFDGRIAKEKVTGKYEVELSISKGQVGQRGIDVSRPLSAEIVLGKTF